MTVVLVVLFISSPFLPLVLNVVSVLCLDAASSALSEIFLNNEIERFLFVKTLLKISEKSNKIRYYRKFKNIALKITN